MKFPTIKNLLGEASPGYIGYGPVPNFFKDEMGLKSLFKVSTTVLIAAEINATGKGQARFQKLKRWQNVYRFLQEVNDHTTELDRQNAAAWGKAETTQLSDYLWDTFDKALEQNWNPSKTYIAITLVSSTDYSRIDGWLKAFGQADDTKEFLILADNGNALGVIEDLMTDELIEWVEPNLTVANLHKWFVEWKETESYVKTQKHVPDLQVAKFLGWCVSKLYLDTAKVSKSDVTTYTGNAKAMVALIRAAFEGLYPDLVSREKIESLDDFERFAGLPELPAAVAEQLRDVGIKSKEDLPDLPAEVDDFLAKLFKK